MRSFLLIALACVALILGHHGTPADAYKGGWEKFEQGDPDVTYYDVLGLTSKATTRQLSKAFRAAAIENHPDKQKGLSKEDADRKSAWFIRAQKAHKTLKDETYRQRYDKLLTTGVTEYSKATWKTYVADWEPHLAK
jgi:hypothetical protein